MTESGDDNFRRSYEVGGTYGEETEVKGTSFWRELLRDDRGEDGYIGPATVKEGTLVLLYIVAEETCSKVRGVINSVCGLKKKL